MTIPPPKGPEEAAREPLRFRRAFLMTLVVAVSLLFVVMIRQLILSVFLAAIFAGLAYPLYSWLVPRVWGRRGLASALTILILFLGIGLPLGAFLAVVVSEAVGVAQAATEWLQNAGDRTEDLRRITDRIPYGDRLIPEGDALVQGLRDLAARAGALVWGTVTGAARGTASFLLQLFVAIYALYFFLVSGPETLRTSLAYVPLASSEKDHLLERFVSVARATLRGSLLIGMIQGGAAGIAFAVAGVPAAPFWGAVMVFLSILPAVGAGLVWAPAVLYLFVVGRVVAAVLLLVWCAVVVGSLDNVLRPKLIGKDAKMSDLMIFLSTLGGIALFGVMGFIVGPIVAALFVTIWHLYGEAFRDWLPATRIPLIPPPPPRRAADAPEGGSTAGPSGSIAGDDPAPEIS